MLRAIFNDLFQRILTLNKWEQRKNLSNRLKCLGLLPGSKVLDFGCGTGLFASIFKKFIYYGYDIDKQFISYASSLYRNSKFTSSFKNLEKEGPFDLIIANCCFHHIEDLRLIAELDQINKLLDKNSLFIMIDLLLVENEANLLRRLYRKLEKGVFVRRIEDYKKLIEPYFKTINIFFEKSHFFSLKYNPIYNELVIFECKK